MQDAMRDKERQQLIDHISDSDLYAGMCDKYTDVSTKQTLVIDKRYVKRWKAVTKFFEVTRLNGDECNVTSLCYTITRVIETREVNFAKNKEAITYLPWQVDRLQTCCHT